MRRMLWSEKRLDEAYNMTYGLRSPKDGDAINTQVEAYCYMYASWYSARRAARNLNEDFGWDLQPSTVNEYYKRIRAQLREINYLPGRKESNDD